MRTPREDRMYAGPGEGAVSIQLLTFSSVVMLKEESQNGCGGVHASKPGARGMVLGLRTLWVLEQDPVSKN